MNRLLIYISIALFPLFSWSQKDVKEKVWKEEKEYLKYHKQDKYKGPDEWYGSYPTNMKDDYYYEDDYSYNGGGNSGQGLQYNSQQLQKDRERYRGIDQNNGEGGNLLEDPTVERPDPIEVPEFDPPDVDFPDIDIPDVDAPTIPPGVWKFLLFLLIFIAVIIVAYLIIKNRKPSNKKVAVDVEDEWNPEVVTKTELELKLDEAMAREDYRTCVRIYFTFILKELINNGWIKWKREKTNHHYLIEMSGKPGVTDFMACIRIYNLVWYGEYHIDRDIYELVRPDLEAYYKSLKPLGE